MQNGKGDRPRPTGVSQETWDKNWSRIFGKRKNKADKDIEAGRVKKFKTSEEMLDALRKQTWS